MVYFFIYWELSIRTGPWPGTHEPLAVHCVRRSGSSAVRTPLMLLPVDSVWCIFYVWEISIRARRWLTQLAVRCSSGPFHTRQFANKLSVADVYESRHNKAAHMLKAGSSVGSLGVEAQGRFFCFHQEVMSDAASYYAGCLSDKNISVYISIEMINQKKGEAYYIRKKFR